MANMADHLVDGPPTKRQKLGPSPTLTSPDNADLGKFHLMELLPDELMGGGGTDGNQNGSADHSHQQSQIDSSTQNHHPGLSQLLSSVSAPSSIANSHALSGSQTMPSQLSPAVVNSLNSAVKSPMTNHLSPSNITNKTNISLSNDLKSISSVSLGNLASSTNCTTSSQMGGMGVYSRNQTLNTSSPGMQPIANGPLPSVGNRQTVGIPVSTTGMSHGSMLVNSLGSPQMGPPNMAAGQGPQAQLIKAPGQPGLNQQPAADPEKRKLIQQQLVLLLHAHKCQRREQANGETPRCSLPHCRTMKNVLNHMTTCNAGKSCPVAHCASSRQIISHWKNCTRNDCPVCLPLKHASDRRNNARGLQPPAAQPRAGNQAPTAGPAPTSIDIQRAYQALGLPPAGLPVASGGAAASTNAGAVTVGGAGNGAGGPAVNPASLNVVSPGGIGQVNSSGPFSPPMNPPNQNQQPLLPPQSPVQQIQPVRPPSGLGNRLPANLGNLGNLSDIGNRLSADLGLGNIMPSDGQNIAQTTRGTKEWHQMVTQDLRNHLVHKLVQAIFPAPDRTAFKDKRMNNLVAYARKVEGDMYNTANSREEYYHLLAEKIYKIQKELEEKRMNRLKEQQKGGPGVLPGPPGQPVRPISSNGPLLPSPNPRLPTPNLTAPNDPYALIPPTPLSAPLQRPTLAGPNSVGQPTSSPPNLSGQLVPPNPNPTSQSAALKESQQQFQEALKRMEQQHSQNLPQKGPLTPQQPLTPQKHIPGANQSGKQSGKHLPNQKSPGAMQELTPQPNQPQAMSLTPTSQHSSMDISGKDMKDMKDMKDIKNEIKSEPGFASLMGGKGGGKGGKGGGKGGKGGGKGGKGGGKGGKGGGKSEPTSVSSDKKEIKQEMDTSSVKEEPSSPQSTTSTGKGAENGSGDAKTPSNGALTPKPEKDAPRQKKIFKPDELRQALMPTLEKLYKQDPESVPFRQPVDPLLLQIPDYFEIVKKPMDLASIKRKLDTGHYKDPWEYVDDVWLMFDNAWLYNRKTSRVYKYCTKLAEVFEGEVDSVMQSLGYCCGRKYVFHPQVLCCYGKQLCTIPRDAMYYSFQNSSRGHGLLADRYVYCEKCFNEIQAEEVELADDPTQPVTRIKKDQFVKMRNDHLDPEPKIKKAQFTREKNDQLDYEPFVECSECGRKLHQICALHFDPIWPQGFTCDNCLRAKGLKKKENKYGAKRLPSTKLGTYLENRVNSFLKKKDSGAGDVTIRVLSCTDKDVEVKSGMKSRYVDMNEMEASFPYRSKAMFAFEEIDGVDVCFFGMHVQEYGSYVKQPNTRRVYISYLDSVHFFQPRHFRTAVYHEILIGYLEYAKQLGYTMAHIWACPPSEGDDYIFHCHPPEQKIPKPKRLQDWYKKMLDKAIIERVVIDYKDILKDAIDSNMTSPSELPYFEGDFWPNVLEESIKELEQEEEEKRKREEAEAAAAAATAAAEESIEIADVEEGPDGVKGKKKGKSGRNKKSNKKNNNQKKNSKKPNFPPGGNDLIAKLYMTMEKHKEVFFVIRLHSAQTAANIPAIQDPDPYVSCELMDGRDAFLTIARDKHYEFSSLRRAMFSTMALLYELHNQGRGDFVYTCNTCKANVETRYHCTVCDDFDLCVPCYEKEQHIHKMERLGFDLDDGSVSDDKQQNPQESRRLSIQRCIQSLVHACQCRDANCRLPSCQKMKRVVAHTKSCKRKTNGGCPICKQLIALCCYHAKHCQETKCPVPFCLNIKHKLRQQQLQQRLQQAQMLRRRMAAMQQRGASVPSSGTTTPTPVQNSIQPVQTPQPPVANKPQPQFVGKKPAPPQGALQAAQQAQMAAQIQASYTKPQAQATMPPPPQQIQVPQQNPINPMQLNANQRQGGVLPSLQRWTDMSRNDMFPPNQPGIQAKPMPQAPPQQPQPPRQIGPNQGMLQQPQQSMNVNPPQRPAQHQASFQQLLQNLKSPTSPQQQQQALNFIKSNPQLMAAIIRYRTQHQQQMQKQQQQQQIQGTPAGASPMQGQPSMQAQAVPPQMQGQQQMQIPPGQQLQQQQLQQQLAAPQQQQLQQQQQQQQWQQRFQQLQQSVLQQRQQQQQQQQQQGQQASQFQQPQAPPYSQPQRNQLNFTQQSFQGDGQLQFQQQQQQQMMQVRQQQVQLKHQIVGQQPVSPQQQMMGQQPIPSPQQIMQQVRSPPTSIGQAVRSPQPIPSPRQQLTPQPVPSPRQPQPSPHHITQSHSPHPHIGGPADQMNSDQVMLPQLQAQQGQVNQMQSPMNTDLGRPTETSEVAPLTPQDQLSRFVETL